MASQPVLIAFGIVLITLSCLDAKDCDLHLQFNGKQFKEVIVGTHKKRTIDVVATSAGDIIYNEIDPEEFGKNKVKIMKHGSDHVEIMEGFHEASPLSITIDKKRDDVYIGTNKGIYKYAQNTGKAVYWKERENDITGIFYKNDILYFSVTSENVPYMYVKDNDDYKKIELKNVDYVQELVVDDHGNFYYNDYNGKFSRMAFDKVHEVVISGIDSSVTALDVTTNNDVLLAAGKKIYLLPKDKTEARFLFERDEPIYALFIDKHRTLYTADDKNIYKYVEDKSCKN